MSTIQKVTLFRLGAMLLLIIVLIAALVVQVPETAAAPDAKEYKLLAIGDSITFGYDNTAEAQKGKVYASYRLFLYHKLKDNYQNVTFDFVGTVDTRAEKSWDESKYTNNVGIEEIQFIGGPGKTTKQIVDGAIKDNVVECPENWCLDTALKNSSSLWDDFTKDGDGTDDLIVLLHLGTNDVNRKKTGQTNQALKDIIADLKSLQDNGKVASVKLFLAQIIPVNNPSNCESDKNFAGDCDNLTNGNITTLNNDINTWCKPSADNKCDGDGYDSIPVYLVNHYKPFFKDNNLQTSLLITNDGVHPSKEGESQIATTWYEAIREVVKDTTEGKWVDMGTVTDHGQALDPALALGQNGAPFIAWSDYSGSDREIYVKEWQNGAWVEKGSGSAKGGGISNTSNDSHLAALTVAPGESPIVAWEERKPCDWDESIECSSEIHVKWWKDGAWKDLGSVSGDSGSAFPGAATRPAVAYSQELGPIVAWHNYHTWQENGETKGAYAIYVKHWNGSAWVEIGSGSASGIGVNQDYANAFTPSLAVRDKDIYIAWANEIAGGNSEIYVKRWNGSAWVAMGNSVNVSQTTGDSWRSSLAIDPTAGWPVVAWEDNTEGNYEIYLKEWNGSAWAEMGKSASSVNVSKTTDDSKWPSLAIGSDGLPVVTWQEVEPITSTWSQVYGKRWDGDSWEEIGGSASGLGISDCDAIMGFGITSKPSLAVDATGAPIVAFDCGISGDYDVYVRRWQAASPPSPPPPDGPYLAINHSSGAPGSFFTLSGSDFPAEEEATVMVNGRNLGSVSIGSAGAFEFVLSTASADEGHYLVTASVNPSASAGFTLAAGGPVWLQEGTGPVMEVPAGIAFMERLFLPVSLR